MEVDLGFMAKSRVCKQSMHFLAAGWVVGGANNPVGQDGWCLPLGHLSSMCLTGGQAHTALETAGITHTPTGTGMS